MTIANSWRATGDVFDTFDRPDVRCPCEEKEGAVSILQRTMNVRRSQADDVYLSRIATSQASTAAS